MPRYDIALVAHIEAPTYEDAMREAKYLSKGLQTEGELVSLIMDYETDNEGQRVLYLHDKDNPNEAYYPTS